MTIYPAAKRLGRGLYASLDSFLLQMQRISMLVVRKSTQARKQGMISERAYVRAEHNAASERGPSRCSEMNLKKDYW